jgi:L-amino acid N-acyltransferase YncA
MDSHIRFVRIEDANSIIDIYNYYVLNTEISFEKEAVTIEEMSKRIEEKIKKYPWIVYEENGKVLGYAYVGKWKERSAYRHTVEDTIYVKESERGKGIGQKLFDGLMEEVVKNKEVHVIMGVIALPNEKSVQIHERNGFSKEAHFKEVGYKNNKWIDVGYWEKVLER